MRRRVAWLRAVLLAISAATVFVLIGCNEESGAGAGTEQEETEQEGGEERDDGGEERDDGGEQDGGIY